jgi:hypothetical protein
VTTTKLSEPPHDRPGKAPGGAGAAAAAELLFDAQTALERLFPGSPAVVDVGLRRLLAEVRCSRVHDVAAVHR